MLPSRKIRWDRIGKYANLWYRYDTHIHPTATRQAVRRWWDFPTRFWSCLTGRLSEVCNYTALFILFSTFTCFTPYPSLKGHVLKSASQPHLPWKNLTFARFFFLQMTASSLSHFETILFLLSLPYSFFFVHMATNNFSGQMFLLDAKLVKFSWRFLKGCKLPLISIVYSSGYQSYSFGSQKKKIRKTMYKHPNSSSLIFVVVWELGK